MKDQNWQRARSDTQRAFREQKILDTAERLFHSKSFDRVTMQMVARESGFCQSNLYRYFKTKEEIFLTLYNIDLTRWIHILSKTFTAKLSIKDFIEKWTEILYQQERLLELSPLLAVILEKNASEDVYRKIKIDFTTQLSIAFPSIQKALPDLTNEMLYDFMFTHAALLAGGRPMSQYSEMQEKVIKELNIPEIKLNFEKFYKKTITIYLKGLLS